MRLSITCPMDAEEVSSSGDSAFTSTVCEAWPTSSVDIDGDLVVDADRECRFAC